MGTGLRHEATSDPCAVDFYAPQKRCGLPIFAPYAFGLSSMVVWIFGGGFNAGGKSVPMMAGLFPPTSARSTMRRSSTTRPFWLATTPMKARAFPISVRGRSASTAHISVTIHLLTSLSRAIRSAKRRCPRPPATWPAIPHSVGIPGPGRGCSRACWTRPESSTPATLCPGLHTIGSHGVEILTTLRRDCSSENRPR